MTTHTVRGLRDGEIMGEIGEPDRVVRRERDPVKTPAAPVPAPELEPAK